jgi:D-serine deaminase-like pyridoxal phosphate-dependent protein
LSFIDMISRPTLLLDETSARRNLERMTAKASQCNVRFRPHFKTHMSHAVGRWCRDAGVRHITVSSPGMALYFARDGWDDITVAFPVNRRQFQEINTLAETIHLGLLVEDAGTVGWLAAHLNARADLWIKIDTGGGRTGIPYDQPEQVVAVARSILGHSLVHFAGILTHAGHTYRVNGREPILATFHESNARMLAVRDALVQAGMKGFEVSIGDTPGCTLTDQFDGADEIRPGNFIFYDAHQWSIGTCPAEDIAVALACPVVAKHPERNEVVVYGGAIHLSKDVIHVDGKPSYGLPAAWQDDRWSAPLAGGTVRMLSQEHGVVQLSPADFERVQLGDLLPIIPAHSCLTVQVCGEYWTLDGLHITVHNR